MSEPDANRPELSHTGMIAHYEALYGGVETAVFIAPVWLSPGNVASRSTVL